MFERLYDFFKACCPKCHFYVIHISRNSIYNLRSHMSQLVFVLYVYFASKQPYKQFVKYLTEI